MNNISNGEKALAMRVSVVSIIVNLVLSLLKALAGVLAHSSAMVSDAIHSASDVFSTIIVIIGIKISHKESDKEHPYGHERLESVAAIVLAAVLAFTGLGIGASGCKIILGKEAAAPAIPGIAACVAAVASILIKAWMYFYTVNAANKIQSAALKADAWHHLSDSLSSVGALAGIIGSRLGFPHADALASVIICLFILKAALDIFRDAVGKLVDRACDEETQNRIREVILNEKGVLGIDSQKTRMFGNKIYIDLEIAADGNSTLREAHEVAENVHDRIEKEFPEVKHIMIHVNPK